MREIVSVLTNSHRLGAKQKVNLFSAGFLPPPKQTFLLSYCFFGKSNGIKIPTFGEIFFNFGLDKFWSLKFLLSVDLLKEVYSN